MKRNGIRISVLLLPLLAAGLLAARVGLAGDLLFIGGTAVDVESPVDGATIEEWDLNGTDVESAKVSFGGSLEAESRVCIQAADDNGPVANGCHFLNGPWNVGDYPLQVDFGSGIPASFGTGLSPTIPASDLTSVNVTVLGPINTSVTGDFPIEVTDVRWLLLGSDTSLVKQVNVVFAPYGDDISTCGDDYECNFDVFLALQDSDGLFLAQHEATHVLDPDNPTTLEWDPVVSLQTGDTGVSAEAITRFIININALDPWDLLASVPDKVGQGAGMTTDGSSLYLLRGGDGDNLYRFEPGSGWTELAPAPKAPKQGGDLVYARDGTGAGYLYAFRGGAKTDFWRFDIGAGEWSTGNDDPADLPKGNGVKWGGSLAWDGNDTIYAFQGGDTPNFWRYDIAADLVGDPKPWTPLPDAPDVVKEGGALVFLEGDPADASDDTVYAMQGGGDVGFWKFDPGAGPMGTWSQQQTANLEITIGRGGALATDGDDLIYALRGDDTKEIWRYQIFENEWAQGPDIPLPMREGGTLVFLGGDVYATQGRQQNEFLRISPLPPFQGP